MSHDQVIDTLAEIRSLPETTSPATDLTPSEADAFARDLERIRALPEQTL